MIISPPFLPPVGSSASEQAWLDAAMPEVPGQGRFPLSLALQWHNGLHLKAPQEVSGTGPLPVRAIADGVVVFVSSPNAVTNKPNDPQNYNPDSKNETEADNRWTDNGMVIVQHTTDIGEGPHATALCYYSLYHHLRELAKPDGHKELAVKDKVWRKDILGQPGKVFAQSGHLHFEIALDEANLQKLMGRVPRWRDALAAQTSLRPITPGRTDSVYGDMYIYLAPSTPVVQQVQSPATHMGTPVAATLGGDGQWVRIAHHLGDAQLSSYSLTGQEITPAPAAEAGAEYNLYAEACRRHQSLTQAQQATSSPSGWYELLRFGRNLGPDPLPAGAEHWRRIATPGGLVWANLNAPGTLKFSDADFPEIAGWNCYGKDNPGKDPNESDQRCEDADLKRLIADPQDRSEKRLSAASLQRRLQDDTVREQLKRVICKFPVEWDKTTVSTRYGWLRQEERFKSDENNWRRFEAHLNAICFDGLPQGYKDAVWHINPKAFIGQMRKCLWLSKDEMKQLVPVKVVRGQKSGMHGPFFYENVPPRGGRLIADHCITLNQAWRKYGIDTRARLAAFVGNSVQETGWWALTEEDNGPHLSYAPWFGRGFLQLTNSTGTFSLGSNYWKYFEFRGRLVARASQAQIAQWRDDVGGGNAHNKVYDPADSAGAYWSWTIANREADGAGINTRRQIVLDAKSQMKNGQSLTIYENVSFRHVACLINLPGAVNSTDPQLNGLVDRYSGYANAQVVLLDYPLFPNAQGQMQWVPEDFKPRRP